jgi:hypothetical protein
LGLAALVSVMASCATLHPLAESDSLGHGGTPDSFLRPTIEVKREALFAALDEVESLADWIDPHMDAAWAWRAARGPGLAPEGRSTGDPEV